MVSALKDFHEDHDITICCKCRQHLTDPRTLPCLDSLCGKCFSKVCDEYGDKSVGMAPCPRCGDQFHLPIDSQRLPDCGFINTLVALKKIAGQNMKDNNCDICKQLLASSESIEAAECYCIECRQRMCAVCAAVHPRHKLVGCGLDSAKAVIHELTSYVPHCANHRGINATAHCYQCSIWLCSQCQNMHSSHEIAVLTDDTYGQLQYSVKLLSDNLHQQLDARKEERGRVQKLLFELQNGVKVAEKEINNKGDDMIALIQKECNDLLSELHSHYHQRMGSLQATSATLLSSLAANITTLKFTEELLEKGSVEDMLLNYRLLNDRVTRLHNLSTESSKRDTVYKDASLASLIDDVCISLKSKSK